MYGFEIILCRFLYFHERHLFSDGIYIDYIIKSPYCQSSGVIPVMATKIFFHIIKTEDITRCPLIFFGANEMSLSIFSGILLPFIGTTFGAAAVFFLRNNSCFAESDSLSGFSAGVMMAASVWSLIIPAVEMTSFLGCFAFVPMLMGLWAGVVFLLMSEKFLSLKNNTEAGNTLFFFAVVLHNIPEGMAVGVAFAMAVSQNSKVHLLSAFMLSLGMTIQNIPEGAIISLPLRFKGTPASKAFVAGTLSGIAEPVFALLTFTFMSVSARILPYLLGFAAGAMLFVSAKELIPKADGTKGSVFFMIGFSVMMVLDIALG